MGRPVKARVAALAGSSWGVESVCIKPAVLPLIVAAALGCIPTAVRPTYTDTRESLRERLSRSHFLDDAHVLRGGNGKRKRGRAMRVRLNETDYRAPRRKSWSVVVGAEREDANGDGVVALSLQLQRVRPHRRGCLLLSHADAGLRPWRAALARSTAPPLRRVAPLPSHALPASLLLHPLQQCHG